MSLPAGVSELEKNVWATLGETVKTELEQSQRELREIALLVEQSQVDVEKLAQRNSTITQHLQQVQGQFDSMPRGEIRTAYDAALDAQQRLVVMRSQLEKLQSEQNHLKRYIGLLRSVQQALEGGPLPENANGKGSLATAEQMIQAQETERQRLSRQMHDGPAQALSNFILLTEIAMRLFDVDQKKARDELANLKNAASSAFQQVRDFIYDLRPMMLDDLGLIPTVKRYVEAFRDKSGLDVTVTVTGNERRLESYLEVMVFRAIQELLANAARHGQAAQVKVQLDMTAEEVRLAVEDNGRGFDAQGTEKGAGLGLRLIKERIEMLGGEFAVDSVVGQGTRVSFSLPAKKIS